MKTDTMFFIGLAVSFLPFALFVGLNNKANVKKEHRTRQYPLPGVAVFYVLFLMLFQETLSTLFLEKFLQLTGSPIWIGSLLSTFFGGQDDYLKFVLFNTVAMVLYVAVKKVLTGILSACKISEDSAGGFVADLFYTYNEEDDLWYIKEHYGQARSFIKAIYYGVCFASALAMFISCNLCMNHLLREPFCPVFPIIIIGEIAFFVDGLSAQDRKMQVNAQSDNAKRFAMYSLLRNPLRELFADKISAEGTTINSSGAIGGAIEDVLADLEKNNGHLGKNYAAFIRKKMDAGLKPNIDYVHSGYDLASGKSLLFNTPFYDKLNPYIFYAMNRELLTGGKILIVLGRHGTEEDLRQWTEAGMRSVSNIPDLWKIEVLSGKKASEDALPDIGIISRSGVHDLDIQKNNLPFLRKVSFVFVVEPSRLVTTAQIGLNLLIRCCGKDRSITFCSVDRNCDGLVDALSHILMANITEVSATEYPPGISSYMYWTADDDYLQHRILPGVSRCLGMGTEISMVALKNQVKKTTWYGGEAYPVLDAHWIGKQYYYDLLDYAQLPTNQETFDKSFRASFNMSDERVSDFSFITVEDDRNNLYETRRNFATIAQQQGFVNVISSEYMLREYMASNTELFTADAKAIPYITADYARTNRNAILSMCLLLCIDSVLEEDLHRQIVMLNIHSQNPFADFWKEVCSIFGSHSITDKLGTPILHVKNRDGKTFLFERDSTIHHKREYNIESGRFESVYKIENQDFSRIILDDLQNASYIAEQENQDAYIGTELKGHVYQKYMPGQFFTLSGKYYEMVSTTADNRILVRRASDHIGGRLSYRQMRNYTIRRLANSASMGALKTVNNIDIHYQYADFSVATPGYWKLRAHNDFDNGQLVEVNGVPIREYHNKLVLKFDFSKLGDAFTDSVRMTLTNLLNEAFVTLFADNQPFISAVTPGNYTAPLTYSLTLEEGCESADKCIFIIEDSQLDIGLLVAVERNTDRIFQIISDYLIWNDEQISKCDRTSQTSVKKDKAVPFDIYEGTESDATKKNIIVRLIMRLVNLLKKKDGSETEATPADPESSETLTPRQKRKAERARKKEERLRKKTEKTASQEPSDQADTELPLSGEAEAITETPKEEEVTEDV